jgi:hypothetical protein
MAIGRCALGSGKSIAMASRYITPRPAASRPATPDRTVLAMK